MATLNIQLAKMSADGNERQGFMTEAVQLINDADGINNQYEPTFIIKGILYLQRGDLNEAFRSFTMTLEKIPSCIPALIGKGRIQYGRKQYRQALKTYQTALSYADGNDYSVEIRLGIGLCYHQLGMNNEAKTAFKRCLQVVSWISLVPRGLSEYIISNTLGFVEPFKIEPSISRFTCYHGVERIQGP
jgi:RNA polymerase-associated protein CTR9